MKSQDANFTLGLRRKSLEASIVKACSRCGAPGIYSSHPSIQMGWPGCYDPIKAKYESTKRVGNICPNCGVKRVQDEFLGELTASMPRWIWKGILVFKRALISLRAWRR